MLRATAGHHSVDARWWWDGKRWAPAFSSDGRQWWDGRDWTSVPRALPRVVAVVVGGVMVGAAFVSMSLLGLVAMGEPVNGDDSNPTWWAGAEGATVGILVVGATVLTLGLVLLYGRRRLRRT